MTTKQKFRQAVANGNWQDICNVFEELYDEPIGERPVTNEQPNLYSGEQIQFALESILTQIKDGNLELVFNERVEEVESGGDRIRNESRQTTVSKKVAKKKGSGVATKKKEDEGVVAIQPMPTQAQAKHTKRQLGQAATNDPFYIEHNSTQKGDDGKVYCQAAPHDTKHHNTFVPDPNVAKEMIKETKATCRKIKKTGKKNEQRDEVVDVKVKCKGCQNEFMVHPSLAPIAIGDSHDNAEDRMTSFFCDNCGGPHGE